MLQKQTAKRKGYRRCHSPVPHALAGLVITDPKPRQREASLALSKGKVSLKDPCRWDLCQDSSSWGSSRGAAPSGKEVL